MDLSFIRCSRSIELRNFDGMQKWQSQGTLPCKHTITASHGENNGKYSQILPEQSLDVETAPSFTYHVLPEQVVKLNLRHTSPIKSNQAPFGRHLKISLVLIAVAPRHHRDYKTRQSRRNLYISHHSFNT